MKKGLSLNILDACIGFSDNKKFKETKIVGHYFNMLAIDRSLVL